MLDEILNTPLISRTRRNHGLEHATLHVLSQRYPNLPMAGHSTPGGFRLVGNLPTEAIQAAVDEALRRLHAGEKRLAVHPNCGTNFVTAGTLAGVSAGLSMLGGEKRKGDLLERLMMASVMGTLALIIGLPLGLKLQERVTTSGEPGSLEIAAITRREYGSMVVHIIKTRDMQA